MLPFKQVWTHNTEGNEDDLPTVAWLWRNCINVVGNADRRYIAYTNEFDVITQSQVYYYPHLLMFNIFFCFHAVNTYFIRCLGSLTSVRRSQVWHFPRCVLEICNTGGNSALSSSTTSLSGTFHNGSCDNLDALKRQMWLNRPQISTCTSKL